MRPARPKGTQRRVSCRRWVRASFLIDRRYFVCTPVVGTQMPFELAVPGPQVMVAVLVFAFGALEPPQQPPPPDDPLCAWLGVIARKPNVKNADTTTRERINDAFMAVSL
jgi:hypothetical protein